MSGCGNTGWKIKSHVNRDPGELGPTPSASVCVKRKTAGRTGRTQDMALETGQHSPSEASSSANAIAEAEVSVAAFAACSEQTVTHATKTQAKHQGKASAITDLIVERPEDIASIISVFAAIVQCA